MDDIEDLLVIGFRLRAPAPELSIADAEDAIGLKVPPVLRHLLLQSDGREGSLGSGREHLHLYSVAELEEYNDEEFRSAFPGLLAIGDNGGLETYALDLQSSPEHPPMVRIDPIDPGSKRVIGADLQAGILSLLATDDLDPVVEP